MKTNVNVDKGESLSTKYIVTVVLKLYTFLRTNTKLTPTQDNYLNTSIYMPLAEYTSLKRKTSTDLAALSQENNFKIARW